MKVKKCRLCNQIFPLDNEFFQVRKDSKDGYRNECKECRKEYLEGYRKENRKEILEYNKDYNEVNKEKRRLYRKENRARLSKYDKKYCQANKESVTLYKKKYKFKRIAKEQNLPSDFTVEQWEKTKQYFDNSCAYCEMTEKDSLKEYGEVLSQEHFIPISKDGGYTKDNIIPSCRYCNSSKSNRDFMEWYPAQEWYSGKRRDKILKYLNIN